MKPRISDAELAVMRLLWHHGRPLSYAEIRTELEGQTGWNKSTIQTLVNRLRDKGFINAQVHHVTLYTPNISEQEHLNAEGKSLVNKLFDGSARNLAASLCRSGDLTAQDVEELRQFFRVEGPGA